MKQQKKQTSDITWGRSYRYLHFLKSFLKLSSTYLLYISRNVKTPAINWKKNKKTILTALRCAFFFLSWINTKFRGFVILLFFPCSFSLFLFLYDRATICLHNNRNFANKMFEINSALRLLGYRKLKKCGAWAIGIELLAFWCVSRCPYRLMPPSLNSARTPFLTLPATVAGIILHLVRATLVQLNRANRKFIARYSAENTILDDTETRTHQRNLRRSDYSHLPSFVSII